MPPIGLHAELVVGTGEDGGEAGGPELLFVLPQRLVQELGKAQPFPDHRQGPRGRLGGLHQVFGELLEPLALAL